MAEEATATRSDCCSGSCGGGGSCDLEGECQDCSPRGWRWLASTEALQREAFGLTPPDDAAGVAATLKDNLLAATIELAETSVEFSWKYWAVDAPFFNRERIVEELVDVNHFVANMLVAMRVTDEEWEAAYQAKQEKNRRRMASGEYSARKGGLGEGSEVE